MLCKNKQINCVAFFILKNNYLNINPYVINCNRNQKESQYIERIILRIKCSYM